jgi:hypothetical protein
LKGSGKKLDPPAGFNAQKLWTACNFNFKLDDYADACARVTKVDAFTVKQNIASTARADSGRDQDADGDRLPNLVLRARQMRIRFRAQATRGLRRQGNGEVRVPPRCTAT